MQNFKEWYHSWIIEQELTISRLAIAKEAFDAGMKCAKNKTCIENHTIQNKEMNTHKGSF